MPLHTQEHHIPDLFTDQVGLADLRVTLPLSDEKLSQEGVQGLLLAAELLATAAVLLVKSTEEPLEHQEGTLRGVGLLGWSDEDSRVLGPVGRVFSEGGSRQDKRWGGQGG